MARDSAIILTWGAPVPGRESRSLKVFGEAFEWWLKQAAAGRCGEPRVFYSSDASGAVFVVEGKSDALHQLMDSDDYAKLTNKATMVVNDLRARMYYGGTAAEVEHGSTLYLQAANELGYLD